VVEDRQPAQDDVAEERVPQMTGGRHDPAHPQLRPELLRVPASAGTGADDLLHRDDVGIDRPDDGRDAARVRPPVEPAAAMDVVGGDAQASHSLGGRW